MPTCPSQPLPDITGWTYAGSTTLNNAQALVWQVGMCISKHPMGACT